MPLSKVRRPTKANCRANVSKNISTLMSEGREQKQAVAIALNVARKAGCRSYKKGHASGRHVSEPKELVATYDDVENNMRAYVYRLANGRYGASLEDGDSGEFVTHVTAPTEAMAIEKAEIWVGRRRPARKVR